MSPLTSLTAVLPHVSCWSASQAGHYAAGHSTTSSLPSHHLLQSTRCGPTCCPLLSHTTFESDFSPPPTFPSTSEPRYLTSMISRKHQHRYRYSLWLYKKPTDIDMYVSRPLFVPIARHLSTLADILLFSSSFVASFRRSPYPGNTSYWLLRHPLRCALVHRHSQDISTSYLFALHRQARQACAQPAQQ